MSDIKITLSKPFTEILKEQKPTYIKTTQTKLSMLQGDGISPVGITVIPPLNTNIEFSKFLKKFELPKTFRLTIPPKQWNWAKISSTDSESIKAKKRLITTPMNQGRCGSCWAVASANCISDVFVVSGKVDKNPNISPTNIMSCYFGRNRGGEGCLGGWPAKALSNIRNQGCTSENCINYSIFCSRQSGCFGSGLGHWDAPGEEMNKFIPNCGCVNTSLPHPLFKISNLEFMKLGGGISVDVIKNKILENGPVVAGYLVWDNFMSGNYRGTGGIYLENYDYDDLGNAIYKDPTKFRTNNHPIINQNGQFKDPGGHAVVIVGWGEDKVRLPTRTSPEKTVKYWIARNSWGAYWGDGGYFKMGMFGNDPVTSNKYSQFEKEIDIGVGPIGGIITFNAGTIETPTQESSSPLNPVFKNPDVRDRVVVENNIPRTINIPFTNSRNITPFNQVFKPKTLPTPTPTPTPPTPPTPTPTPPTPPTPTPKPTPAEIEKCKPICSQIGLKSSLFSPENRDQNILYIILVILVILLIYLFIKLKNLKKVCRI